MVFGFRFQIVRSDAAFVFDYGDGPVRGNRPRGRNYIPMQLKPVYVVVHAGNYTEKSGKIERPARIQSRKGALSMRKSFLVALAVSSAIFFSCAIDPEVVRIWGGDVSVPELLSLEVVSETGLVARFSRPVSLTVASVAIPGTATADSGDEVLDVSWGYADDGKTVELSVSRNPGIGVRAVLSGTVEDERGNTLTFAFPYTGWNDRVPDMVINEVRVSYSKPKVEYVELFMLSDGNLGGVKIENPRNAKNPSYEFPSAEVRAGEYVVWHVRSVEEGLVDEIGAADASGGTEARIDARDFWSDFSSSPLKADNALLLRARKGGPIVDALLLSSGTLADWPTDEVRAAAKEAFESGAWQTGAGIGDAASSFGASPTRTVGRDSLSTDTDGPGDWAVCATSKCSPGAVNAAR